MWGMTRWVRWGPYPKRSHNIVGFSQVCRRFVTVIRAIMDQWTEC